MYFNKVFISFDSSLRKNVQSHLLKSTVLKNINLEKKGKANSRC